MERVSTVVRDPPSQASSAGVSPGACRKASWQRYKIKTDADYRTQQKLSHQKWVGNAAGYWKRYRQRHSDKAERNRTLQHIRNRRRRQPAKPLPAAMIAKMDARKFCHFNMVGQFYLVPLIAKMEVSRVNIYKISDCYL